MLLTLKPLYTESENDLLQLVSEYKSINICSDTKPIIWINSDDRAGAYRSAGLRLGPPSKDAVNGPFYLFSVNHDSKSPR